MGILEAMANRVAGGSTVEFRPSGSSMVPLIRRRQLVTVAPVDPTLLDVGDIVLARVAGAVYLHLVSALDHSSGRVQISNNRGRVNGWTGHARSTASAPPSTAYAGPAPKANSARPDHTDPDGGRRMPGNESRDG